MGDYIVLFRNWRDYIATVPAQDMDAMERAAGTKSIKIINYVYIPFFLVIFGSFHYVSATHGS